MFKLLIIIIVLGSRYLPLPQGCLLLYFAQVKGKSIAVMPWVRWRLPDLDSGGCVIVAVIALLEATWVGTAELGEVPAFPGCLWPVRAPGQEPAAQPPRFAGWQGSVRVHLTSHPYPKAGGVYMAGTCPQAAAVLAAGTAAPSCLSILPAKSSNRAALVIAL